MRSVSVGAGHEYGGEEGRIDKLAEPDYTTHTAHAGCLGDVDQEFAQRSRSRKQGDRERGSRRRWPKIEERQTNAGRSAEGPGADAVCTDESGEGNGEFVRGRSGICRRHRIGTGGGRGGRIWRQLRGRRSRSNGASSSKLHGSVSSQRRSRGETYRGSGSAITTADTRTPEINDRGEYGGRESSSPIARPARARSAGPGERGCRRLRVGRARAVPARSAVPRCATRGTEQKGAPVPHRGGDRRSRKKGSANIKRWRARPGCRAGSPCRSGCR